MFELMHNGGSLVVAFFCLVSMVKGLWEVTAFLGNGCAIQGQKYLAWLQESEIPVRFHIRNLILGT